MALKKVILREKIKGLGLEADIVAVKAGYARNFLLPQKKAYEATKENLAHLESLQRTRDERESEELRTAKFLAGKINKLKLNFVLETGETGKAFGSVTSIDIHKKLEAEGFELDRTMIHLDKPIKKSGKVVVEVKPHPDVTSNLTINIESPQATKETQEEKR